MIGAILKTEVDAKVSTITSVAARKLAEVYAGDEI